MNAISDLGKTSLFVASRRYQALGIALPCKGVESMEEAENASVFITFYTLNNGTKVPQNGITANDSVVVSSGMPDIKRKYMKAKKDEP